MSSNVGRAGASLDVAVSIKDLSKSYLLYRRPSDRLRQMMVNAARRLVGLKPMRMHSEIRALKPLSFELERGKTIAIIGLNGAGKSTLLQLICGTVEPTTGRVDVNGKLAALLELGAGFDASLTGRQNVMFGGLVLGMTHDEVERKFESIAKFADIGEFLEYPVNTYSTGMYVRLAFALAIHSDPEILIVDEALSVGDFMFQQKCNRHIKENLANTTKLLVTHDLGAVTNLADSVIVLHHGELVFWGEPKAAIERYQMIAREEQRAGAGAAAADVPAVDESASCSGGYVATDAWTLIRPDQLSGRKQAVFTRFCAFVDGIEGAEACRTGADVRVRFEVSSEREFENVIIGYQMQDRFGNVVFASNSISSGLGPFSLSAGRSLFELAFEWPLVAAEKYGLTLGLGVGNDSIHHVIECWAHNITALQSAPKEDLHGIFNVNLSDLKRL
jgi:ABC-type polysaccharide/polyol phosphate transport system ATPase subunit